MGRHLRQGPRGISKQSNLYGSEYEHLFTKTDFTSLMTHSYIEMHKHECQRQQGWKSNFKTYEICNMNLHMQIIYQWRGGRQEGCRQLPQKGKLPGFLTVVWISSLQMVQTTRWKCLFCGPFTRFSNGQKAKNLKFQWVLPYTGALAIRGLNQSLKSKN